MRWAEFITQKDAIFIHFTPFLRQFFFSPYHIFIFPPHLHFSFFLSGHSTQPPKSILHNIYPCIHAKIVLCVQEVVTNFI